MKEEARQSVDSGVKAADRPAGECWRCGMAVEPPLPAACYQRSRHFKFQKVIRIYLFIPCPVPERISGSDVIGKSHHVPSQGQKRKLPTLCRHPVNQGPWESQLSMCPCHSVAGLSFGGSTTRALAIKHKPKKRKEKKTKQTKKPP